MDETKKPAIDFSRWAFSHYRQGRVYGLSVDCACVQAFTYYVLSTCPVHLGCRTDAAARYIAGALDAFREGVQFGLADHLAFCRALETIGPAMAADRRSAHLRRSQERNMELQAARKAVAAPAYK